MLFCAVLVWISRRIQHILPATPPSVSRRGDSFYVEFKSDGPLPASTTKTGGLPRILILTPVKNAATHLDRFYEMLRNVSYPPSLLSLGVLDSDSDDVPDAETLAAAAAAVDGGGGGGVPSGTLAALLAKGTRLVSERGWRRVAIARHDFGFTLAREARHGLQVQAARRAVLARSRNHLLSLALRDEDWVVWIDVDLKWYPRDIFERLLGGAGGLPLIDGDGGGGAPASDETGPPLRRILVPNCVMKLGGGRSYDLNSWRGAAPSPGDSATVGEVIAALEAAGKGAKRVGSGGYLALQGYAPTGARYLHHFRDRTNEVKNPNAVTMNLSVTDNKLLSAVPIWLEADAAAAGADAVVRLDAVGGAMLLVHAELHRHGLMFPPFNYRSRIETEGLSMMALDMGVLSWGMPFLEILHK